MLKTNTQCCALAQLSGLNNNTTKEEILKELLILKQEREELRTPDDTLGGQTAIFVICTDKEELLKNNLLSLGFKEVHQFERRNGYPEGLLSMLIINI